MIGRALAILALVAFMPLAPAQAQPERLQAFVSITRSDVERGQAYTATASVYAPPGPDLTVGLSGPTWAVITPNVITMTRSVSLTATLYFHVVIKSDAVQWQAVPLVLSVDGRAMADAVIRACCPPPPARHVFLPLARRAPPLVSGPFQE